ncbi:Uncharacterised protein [uncultured archaeon]|nr:Uncharacterised protein [uncultured archaeon]
MNYRKELLILCPTAHCERRKSPHYDMWLVCDEHGNIWGISLDSEAKAWEWGWRIFNSKFLTMITS